MSRKGFCNYITHICEWCGVQYKYRLTLNTPEQRTHFCERCIDRQRNLIKHEDLKKNPIKKTCRKCGSIFETSNKQRINCDICKKKESRSKAIFVREICKNCGKVFEYNKNHNIYQRTTLPEYCSKCKPKADYRKYIQKNGQHRLWARATISSHKKRGHIVLIDENILTDIARQTTTCQVCGIELSYFGKGGTKAKIASLDRIKNHTTYSENDIGIICKRCNTLKNNIEFDQFKKVISGWTNYIRKVEPNYNP